MRLIVTKINGATGTAEIIDGKPVLAGEVMVDMKPGAAGWDPLTKMRNPDPAKNPAEWLRAFSFCFRNYPYFVIAWEDDGRPSPGPWKEK
jgi:hypothetical protein